MPCNLVSVVVPVYNEAEVIGEMYRRLPQVASTLPDLEYELVVVTTAVATGATPPWSRSPGAIPGSGC